MIEQIQTPNAPEVPSMLSQAIIANGFIFVSGQVHKQPGKDGVLVSGDIKVKTAQVIENIKQILEASGSSLNNVVKVTTYLTDMSTYSLFNEEYIKHFSSPFPVREVVCVKELPLKADVEISVVAVLN
jgi:2-iminobutanoate/2-iminopropanoate deaminase